MNHEERIAALESQAATQAGRIAALEFAVEGERRERAALPKVLLPQAVETRRMLEDLQMDLEMNVRAFDVRIAEVAAREPSSSGPALSLVTARAVANYVRELLARDVWLRLDDDLTSLLVASFRLTSQLCWALADPQQVRAADGDGESKVA